MLIILTNRDEESDKTNISGDSTCDAFIGVYAEKSGDPNTTLLSNVLFKKNGDIWEPETTVGWPDYVSDFYAWAPAGAASLGTSGKSFDYTVESDNENQTDLLVASYDNVSANYKGILPLEFEHALCEVKFVTSEKMPAGMLSSLKISGVSMKGTYCFNPEAGESQTPRPSHIQWTFPIILNSRPERL